MAASFPQKIDRFHIRQILGRGSQGIVYLAQDPDLGREVAIKTVNLKAKIQRNANIDQLVSEARAVNKLQHANIVTIYDIRIENTGDEKIRDRIPDWYHQNIAARSFTLFPVVIRETPIALIYIDHVNAEPIKITDAQLGLLKTLRNQAILALKSQA